MNNIIIDGKWNIHFDYSATKLYHQGYTDSCPCDVCRNFRQLNKDSIPVDIKNFVEQFGADITKPAEMAWIRVDKKQRLVEYYFYYVVSGTVEPLNESYIEIKKIGETDIFIAPKRGSPNTEMSEPYFFIAIFTLWLPWIIDDVDMDEL